MKIKQKNTQAGISLLDSILGIMVMAIGFTSGLAALGQATQVSLSSENTSVAAGLAHEKLEEILADKSLSGPEGYALVTSHSYPSERIDNVYTRTVIVTEVSPVDMESPEAGSGYKKIDVQVSWGNNSAENIIVSTLLANY